MNKKIKDLVFVVALGCVSAALLLGAGSYARPLIRRHREAERKRAIVEAAGTNAEVHVIVFEGAGLWAPIEGIVALDPDLRTIRGVSIISQEETPGLGGRIGEKTFLDQFRGKKASPRLFDEIDAITGATMTSRAFVKMVNGSVEEFRVKARR